eukprot:TRINITY_DN8375_c0_g1_i1.p1 TRINITY_DN8375_c0_g1~~TRINITY_DN8375_c0_g1_i1.p1  ORF type:complete len:842 (-),score=179.78 TRINITY_DN8375_c0_g1_i1:3-2528(-)
METDTLSQSPPSSQELSQDYNYNFKPEQDLELQRRISEIEANLKLSKSKENLETHKSTLENSDVEITPSKNQLAEVLARKLLEEGKQRRAEKKKELEEKKRRREEEEDWKRLIKKKVEEERKRIETEEKSLHSTNKELNILFNDLQGIAQDFKINFEAPEIVVVGMQSDGKSSFIEGLLGFQFNLVDSNIGTRRPLILQMINDPTKDKPSCRFRRELSSSMGDEDPFEEEETPLMLLSSEIVRRTTQVAGRGDRVSASPIFLRVRYCNCANLTIWDTPGFRLGGDESLKKAIEKMVIELMDSKYRIIVCLEQSTVEWANTVSRPIVRKIDPSFSRTILINTKFDNRVKELRNKDTADIYLNGEGLPPNKKPFFITLPVQRDLDADEYNNAILDVYLSDYRQLLEAHFDEHKYLPQVGFHRVKQTLEKLLNDRYHQSLGPTLRVLEDILTKTQRDLDEIQNEISMNNVEEMKTRVNKFVVVFIVVLEKLLQGSIIGNPEVYGQTLTDEKLASGIGEWPDYAFNFEIPHQHRKLYGGAQFERLMNEFECVTHSQEFPLPSINEVATSLGISKGHNVPILETAASDIVQFKSRKVLQPLSNVAMKRCVYVMKRLFEVALSVLNTDQWTETTGTGLLTLQHQFIDELHRVFDQFVSDTEASCSAKLRDDFDSLTKMMDWDLIHGLTEINEYDVLEVTQDDTKKRVMKMLQRKDSLSSRIHAPKKQKTGPGSAQAQATSEDLLTYEAVCQMSGKLFAGIRYFFVKFARTKFNAFFVDPMFQKLGSVIMDHFRTLLNSKYEEMFNLGLDQLKQQEIKLTTQLHHIKQSRDRFKELLKKISSDMRFAS